ncbi:NAD dependent epimerase/dehydratase family protein [Aeromicrobium marinum DSM 15272]|uniref:NAD dependent epimerase/dehydratase family protein n=1 Tax=Aeromicrobium marinum DSM 15272 TaxID=585531 RepID=E2SF21_9ACTN|nr:SDR family oxidoreductase [Aeromicrobium marinum]EFQ82265.1 NAD dependent epimerase/dehydratase family protein [Aeromicrobium marinum DSM 15272]
MATIAVVGGAGQIARHLHPLLLAAGHRPVALVRRREQADELGALGVDSRLLDLEAAGHDEFVAALEGADAVVFAAGGGADGDPERKRTVDLEGSLKSIAAASALGVDRFVQVSAIGVDAPVPDDTPEVWRAYVEAKRAADVALRESDLAWTILRPGGLTDDEPTGRVTLAADVERSEIPRADVAAVIAAVIDDGRAVRQQWELVGGQVPVLEAVTAATTT